MDVACSCCWEVCAATACSGSYIVTNILQCVLRDWCSVAMYTCMLPAEPVWCDLQKQLSKVLRGGHSYVFHWDVLIYHTLCRFLIGRCLLLSTGSCCLCFILFHFYPLCVYTEPVILVYTAISSAYLSCLVHAAHMQRHFAQCYYLRHLIRKVHQFNLQCLM